jgi:hypothetical protein
MQSKEFKTLMSWHFNALFKRADDFTKDFKKVSHLDFIEGSLVLFKKKAPENTSNTHKNRHLRRLTSNRYKIHIAREKRA